MFVFTKPESLSNQLPTSKSKPTASEECLAFEAASEAPELAAVIPAHPPPPPPPTPQGTQRLHRRAFNLNTG